MTYLNNKFRKKNADVLYFCITLLLMFVAQLGNSQEKNPKNWPTTTQEIIEAFNNGQKSSANKDYTHAVQYYRIAAEKGLPPAQFELGCLYLQGKGVAYNIKEGFKWIKLSAEAGWSRAYTPLAGMYYEGLGTTKNVEEATKWYFKGAEYGDKEAQFCIGLAYNIGEGVPQSYLNAAKWYEKAAKQGHAGAANNLASIYLRKHVEPLISSEDGIYWLKKAADMGDKTAQFSLAVRYWKGVGVPQNKDKALELMHKSAAQGFFEAQKAIAEIEASNK